VTLTSRETWTLIHGMILGAIFLLAFAGGLAELYDLRPEWLTSLGITTGAARMKLGLWVMTAMVWLTVIVGTFIVYPWYRATPPKGTTDLSLFPRSQLLAQPTTAGWHTFGMEWKEHVGWLAPIAATLVAFLITYYGPALAKKVGERRAAAVWFIAAFAAAAIAGMLGAFITKSAPLH
jgi:hypothetical protein